MLYSMYHWGCLLYALVYLIRVSGVICLLYIYCMVSVYFVKQYNWWICCYAFSSFLCTAHIPLYLYPFLNTTSKSRPFEYLRLTSLGVIGALVKVHHPVPFLFLVSLWFWCSPPTFCWKQRTKNCVSGLGF